MLQLLADRLPTSGVRPERLILEVTETAAIRNLSDARAFANRLHALGCRVSLDDFGTGFARVVGRTTIAEWVEDEDTLQLLEAYGVDQVQGHHTGRPQPLEALGL